MKHLNLPEAVMVAITVSLCVYGCSEPRNIGSPVPGQSTSQHSVQARDPRVSISDQHEQERGKRQTATNPIAAPKLVERRNEKSASDLDPAAAGWDSEAASDLADQQLRKLADLLTSPAAAVPERLKPLLASRFSCTALRSNNTRQLRRDSAFLVERDEIDEDQETMTRKMEFHGPEGFATALEHLFQSLPGKAPQKLKFKVIGVELADHSFETRQLFDLSIRTSTGMIEQHAVWSSGWEHRNSDGLPRLRWIRLESREQTTTHMDHGSLFSDCTGSILGKSPKYQELLGTGIDYWLQRIEAMLMGPFGHHGLSIGDANGDGRDDVYVCQPGGLPNMLLLQNENGTAYDSALSAGVDLLDFTRSALFVDLNNDGTQDLVVATMTQILVFSNNGLGKFELRVKKSGIQDPHSITAADFDNDGRLDLYACSYSGDGIASRGSPTPLPIHDARNGGRNTLLKNRKTPQSGPWILDDATESAGLNEGNNRWSYAAAWEDYDNDGDVDLYVANDFGPNSFYRNDAGVFIDYSIESGLGEAAFGMSVTWGDYDRDGHTDVYVSNMFSSAGNRITTQSHFQPGADDDMRRKLQHAARGNSLFRNQGDGTFRDVSGKAGVTMGRWAWSSLFSDINNDGLVDLLVGNGFMSRADTDDL